MASTSIATASSSAVHQARESNPFAASSHSVNTLQGDVMSSGASAFSTETLTSPPEVPKLPNPIPPGFDYSAFFAAKAEAQRALLEYQKNEASRQEAEAKAGEDRTGVKRRWSKRPDSKRKTILRTAAKPVGWIVKGVERESPGGGQNSIFW